MGIYGFLGVCGCMWVPMGVFEYLWVCMGVYGFPWVYGYLWAS